MTVTLKAAAFKVIQAHPVHQVPAATIMIHVRHKKIRAVPAVVAALVKVHHPQQVTHVQTPQVFCTPQVESR